MKDSFKTLNFNSFAENKEYCSLFIKEESDINSNRILYYINPYKPLTRELTESKMEFSNDLKLFNRCLKNLVVNDFGGYHYLICEIPNIFPNITKLVLDSSAFTMDTLQSLLGSFKCLENLELTKNLIFHNNGISNGYTINYPVSLKSLKLGENSVIMVQDNVNCVSIYRNMSGDGIHEFNGTYQHFPNLVAFDYNVSCDSMDENGDLFKFIRLNPQLKTLKLSGNTHGFELFDIIKNCENLIHLEHNCLHHTINFEGYEMLVLRSITHLHLKNICNDLYEIINGKFPNVIELVEDIDWSISHENEFLTESFPNVKYLKFIFNYYIEDIGNFTLSELKYLESIEINLNYENAEFENFNWDLTGCEKLKLVTFTKSSTYTHFEEFELTEELAKNWDLYYFPHKLAFIRNS